jgi:hypothetical protein
MARLKSCPDTKQSFSAARKVVSPRKIEFSRRLSSPRGHLFIKAEENLEDGKSVPQRLMLAAAR